MAVDNVRRKRLPNQPPREVVDKVTRKRITDMTNWKVTIITIIIVTSVLFIVDMMSANNHEKRISALESRLPPEKVCRNETYYEVHNYTAEIVHLTDDLPNVGYRIIACSDAVGYNDNCSVHILKTRSVCENE